MLLPCDPLNSADELDSARRRRRPCATYRRANVDAGIVQPKAYDVDRAATLEALRAFLAATPALLDAEAEHLSRCNPDLVLSDATFLGLAAARRARVPAALVSNFTFDTCYSYLTCSSSSSRSSSEQEAPLERAEMLALAEQTRDMYACANLVVRLPGVIPLPAFEQDMALPEPRTIDAWLTAPQPPPPPPPPQADDDDDDDNEFTPEMSERLRRPAREIPKRRPSLEIVDGPLIVRAPSERSRAYTRAFRAQTLGSVFSVPRDVATRDDLRVLLVSFGGQVVGAAPDRALDTLLPNDSSDAYWIAILSSGSSSASDAAALPARFYAPPPGTDTYVPDLMAISDVVLGKLGYGTCAESLSSSTAFVYVPRPLFIEEHGLRALMRRHEPSKGTAVQLARDAFERGHWAQAVRRAYDRGKAKKDVRRKLGWAGLDGEGDEGARIASILEDFATRWHSTRTN